MSCQRQESLECELVSRAVHYQCTEVGATLTQTRCDDMQTDMVSSSEDCKVETSLSPMEQERQRPSVSRPSDRDCFVPINLRQIKRELFIVHEIQNDGSSPSPMELNNSIDIEHNVREEDIKDEPTSYKELESDVVFDIKIESSDVDDNNETTDGGTVLYEERERVACLNEDIQIEEIKTETLEEADDEQSTGGTRAGTIQDGGTLAPGGENVLEEQRTRSTEEQKTSRNIGRHELRSTTTTKSTDCTSTKHSRRTFVCDDCGDVFGDKCLLIEHIEQHVTDNKTSRESSKQRTRLLNQKYYYIEARRRRFTCKICQVRFIKKGHLKAHLRRHTGEKPYKCEICKFSFSQKSNLNTHLRIHTGEKPYECEICKVRFRYKFSLKIHLRIHTGEKPYECEICKANCRRKSDLKKHLRIHTGDKPYECEICKVRFRYKILLKTHLRIHTGEETYECEICKVRFCYKINLKAHLRSHTGEKPYECEICKVKFSEKGNLKKHLRIHTDEKPYECEICKGRFISKDTLETHLNNIHLGEKLYECGICKARYARKHNSYKHCLVYSAPSSSGSVKQP